MPCAALLAGTTAGRSADGDGAGERGKPGPAACAASESEDTQ